MLSPVSCDSYPAQSVWSCGCCCEKQFRHVQRHCCSCYHGISARCHLSDRSLLFQPCHTCKASCFFWGRRAAWRMQSRRWDWILQNVRLSVLPLHTCFHRRSVQQIMHCYRCNFVGAHCCATWLWPFPTSAIRYSTTLTSSLQCFTQAGSGIHADQTTFFDLQPLLATSNPVLQPQHWCSA